MKMLNKRGTAILKNACEEVGFKLTPGDLLIHDKNNPFSMQHSLSVPVRPKPLYKDYPAFYVSADSLNKELAMLRNVLEKPFLFLGWAAYSSIWRTPLERSQAAHFVDMTPDRYMLGMHILLEKTTWFLTFNQGFTKKNIDSRKENFPFFCREMARFIKYE